MNNEENIQEPASGYEYKSRIRSFQSFEAMNEADAAEMAKMSGIEHLINTVGLIKKVYAEELKHKMVKTVHFK